jgi:Na+-driven multidrug efflux pump
MATSTVVGQNVGAGQILRARKTVTIGSRIAFGTLTVIGLLAAAAAEPIVTLFVPGEPAVIENGAQFIRMWGPTWGFVGVQIVIGGGFSGAGRTSVSMALALISLWVLRFPLAFLLSERTALGLNGIWWAFPVSNVVSAGLAIAWFVRTLRTRPAPDDVEDAMIEDRAVAEATVERPME